METQDDELSDQALAGPAAMAGELQLAAAVRAGKFPGLEATPSLVDDGAPAAPSLRSLARLGRYAVLRELGRGGMGIVYACYDEQLGRKLAVKLLRARFEDEVARRRLEREAQALARLSHPNVVQIYELGEHYGDLFVAMEFVAGQTLRDWLCLGRGAGASATRGWREVASLLRELGGGLAAAHEAGLVHRDFKPDNVIVGDDGRPRVLDFGLARHAPSGGEPRTLDELDEGRGTEGGGGHDLGTEVTALEVLTRVGAIMGTPAYMAPEQFQAALCDATSDQYSFCVVAFEALFGRRPFEAETFAELSRAVLEGSPATTPADSPVPGRLRAAVLRGLSREPSERWPDMAALLSEFDEVLGAARRPWRIAAGLGLVALLAGGAALYGTRAQAPVCVFDELALADAWGEEQRAALWAARPERSPESTGAIERELTQWGERWLDSQRRNCAATWVDGSQSAQMLDQRGACLERQRREVAAITAQLTSADAPSSSAAFELIDRLPDVAICDDPDLAMDPHPMPSSAPQREAILAAYGELSAVRSLARAHRLDEADERARALEAEAERVAFLPLTLELRFLASERSLWRGQIDEAVPGLRAVIHDAEVAQVDELSAELRTLLATTIVGQWGPAATQEAALEEAETALERLGRPDDRRHLTLAQARAAWIEDRGDLEAALALHRANIEAAERREERVLLARAQQALGRTLVALERFEEAERAYGDARANFTKTRGPGSLDEARVDLDLVLLALPRGDFELAAAGLEQLRQRHAALLEPGSQMFGMVGVVEGKLALMRGRLDAASQAFGHVIEQGADDLHRGEAWQGLGVVRFYQDDMAASLEAYAQARAVFLRALGPEHPAVGLLDSNIGESLAGSGDHPGALEAYARALACLEAALPVDHLDLALPIKARGQSRLALGEVAAARQDLERALSIHRLNPGEPIEHADVEFSLARALVEGDPARARALAESARDRLRALGYVDDAAEIEAWLEGAGLGQGP